MVFVFWSGGVDSTALILHYLKQGLSVGAGYVNLVNNHQQMTRQLEAMEKMTVMLTSEYGDKFKFLGKISSYQSFYGTRLRLPQPHIWFSSLVSVPNVYERVAFGYILGDHFISFLEDAKRIVREWTSLLGHKVELEFPLTRIHKSELWVALGDYQRHITYCESDNDHGFCGNCHCCKSFMLDVGYDIHLNLAKINRESMEEELNENGHS